MHVYHSSKKKDYKSAKIDNNVEKFQEQRLKPYSKFINKNTKQKKRFLLLRKSAGHSRATQ